MGRTRTLGEVAVVGVLALVASTALAAVPGPAGAGDPPPPTFVDVPPAHPFHAEITWVAEQGIATVNELAAPVDRPIHFKLTASSTMNAFYVPDLAGMIYSMPGMQTELNAVINRAGVFKGLASHYSGPGFSGMTFKFHGLPEADFEQYALASPALRDRVARAAEEVARLLGPGRAPLPSRRRADIAAVA